MNKMEGRIEASIHAVVAGVKSSLLAELKTVKQQLDAKLAESYMSNQLVNHSHVERQGFRRS